MAAEININSITVLLASRKARYSFLIQLGLSQNASAVPELSGIKHDDDAMHGYANDLQKVLRKFKAKLPTATKEDVEIIKNILIDAYDENAKQIESIARKQAKLAGDVNVGINIVQNAGYRLKRPKSAISITFEVKRDGRRAVKIKTKSVAHHATYIRQYGKTSDDGIVPLKEDLEELLVSPEADLRLDSLQSITWYAFREAYILPISRKAKGKTSETNLDKKVSTTLITKKHRRTYHAGSDSNYNFGPWIWVLVS